MRPSGGRLVGRMLSLRFASYAVAAVAASAALGCGAAPRTSDMPTAKTPAPPSPTELVATLDRPLYAMLVDDERVYGIQESEPPRAGVAIRYELVTLDRRGGRLDRQPVQTVFALTMDSSHLYWDGGGVIFAQRKGEREPREVERSRHGFAPIRFCRLGDAVYWQSGAEVHRAKSGRVDVIGSLGEPTTLLGIDEAFFYTDSMSAEGKPGVVRVSRATGAREWLAPVWDIAQFFVDNGAVFWVDTRFWLHKLALRTAKLGPPEVLDNEASVRELAIDGGVVLATTALGLRRYEGGSFATRHVLAADEELFGRPALHRGRVFVSVAPHGGAPRVVSMPLWSALQK